MDESMKLFQKHLTELEIEAERLLLSRNQGALTALRKRARTTKSSVPSPFDSIMKGVTGTSSRPLVQEVCTTCGNHDYGEQTWMMFPGTDLFASIPFHAAHTIIETGSFFIPCQPLFTPPTATSTTNLELLNYWVASMIQHSPSRVQLVSEISKSKLNHSGIHVDPHSPFLLTETNENGDSNSSTCGTSTLGTRKLKELKQ
ncbi:p53 and DNA damage-regulated protein 1 [Senna tora]|uniref:p53 and DNA damage-regulated protein 1 n=1 Tax=Senna tora TaxID=362788 RepID=A0A834SDW1_9FABA|nr:p53 and DNA damage-regulated protein 1 [Senna tora]